MRQVVILGGSGIGMIAASILERSGVRVLGFLNDVLASGTAVGKYRRHEVLGTTDDLPRFLEQPDTRVFIAYVGLQNEKRTYEKIEKLDIPRERFVDVVDPSAVAPAGYCGIGTGILLGPLAQLSPDTTVADNCILLGNSFLGHDSVMDRFAHLATNAVVGANVRIGRGAHVGSNATIREKIRVGDFALIGAGSVVLEDVPANAVVVGNPARVLELRRD